MSEDDDRVALGLLDKPLDLDWLRRHVAASKVNVVVDGHLRRLGELNPNIEGLRAEIFTDCSSVADVGARRAAVLGALARAAAVAEAVGVRLMAVKGASMFLLLPDYMGREVNDLDLLVPDLPGLWRLVAALRSKGWCLDESENVWIQNFGTVDQPELHGHVTLKDEQEGIWLDVHSGCMSFALTGLLRCSLWERASRATMDDTSTLVPSPEDALLYNVAHAANHTHFTMKDLNDAYEVLKRYGGQFDWVYVLRAIHENGLRECFTYLMEVLRARYHFTPLEAGVPAGSFGLIAWLLSINEPLRTMGSLWVKASIQAVLTAKHEAMRNGDHLRRFGLVCRSYVRSIGDHLLTRFERLPSWLEFRLKKREAAPYFRPYPRRGSQILFTEVDPGISEQLWTFRDCEDWPGMSDVAQPFALAGGVLISVHDQELLVTRAGIFSATVSMLFSDEDLAAQEDLAKSIVARVIQDGSLADGGPPLTNEEMVM